MPTVENTTRISEANRREGLSVERPKIPSLDLQELERRAKGETMDRVGGIAGQVEEFRNEARADHAAIQKDMDQLMHRAPAPNEIPMGESPVAPVLPLPTLINELVAIADRMKDQRDAMNRFLDAIGAANVPPPKPFQFDHGNRAYATDLYVVTGYIHHLLAVTADQHHSLREVIPTKDGVVVSKGEVRL